MQWDLLSLQALPCENNFFPHCHSPAHSTPQSCCLYTLIVVMDWHHGSQHILSLPLCAHFSATPVHVSPCKIFSYNLYWPLSASPFTYFWCFASHIFALAQIEFTGGLCIPSNRTSLLQMHGHQLMWIWHQHLQGYVNLYPDGHGSVLVLYIECRCILFAHYIQVLMPGDEPSTVVWLNTLLFSHF